MAVDDESQQETEFGIEAMQVVIDLRAENVRLKELVDGKCSRPVSKLLELRVAEARRKDAEENRRLRDALKLPLLFHRGGEWTTEHGDEWERITGIRDATSKFMCDAIRLALAATEGDDDDTTDR